MSICARAPQERTLSQPERSPPPAQLEVTLAREAEFVICDYTIEENFLDDKSNGFQLESSEVREAQALSRLCFVIAMTTLYLVAQGKRRWVDPHWFRGSSYLKIGWNWINRALMKGWELITQLRLPGG
ncbi:MAG: hypothetical protein ACE5JP_16645, partial [Candidatus Bipolaricaulia bacterium]